MTPEKHGLLIIGSGFAGLAMAIALRRTGRHDFVVLEQSAAPGGTWRANHYPGCACDIPSHLYSYSFAPNPDWSRTYAPHHEIRAYIDRCVERFSIQPHLRFGATVATAEFDEARTEWTVCAIDGRAFSAPILVTGIGGLSRPLRPRSMKCPTPRRSKGLRTTSKSVRRRL